MNIVFTIKALGNQGGGAERVLVEVVNGLAARGHVITIISSDTEGTDSYYQLDDSIRRVNLGIGDVSGTAHISDVIARIRAFRCAVTKIEPDVVVAFMHSSYLLSGIALVGTNIPMIASEHTSPEHYRNRWLERVLLSATPVLARRITVVSQQILDSFDWWLRRRMVVVSNPVSISIKKQCFTPEMNGGRGKVLLSVGRLGPEKNQKCLIAAFSKISNEFPSWKLRIVGEGGLRSVLESQVHDLGLIDRVELPGAIADIKKEYISADLFALPSTYESFGLATAEALLSGLPAIGFADCPGTNNLIRHGENGLLVQGMGDSSSLADALRSLMIDSGYLNQLSNASTESLENIFSISSVLNSWERLIEEVVAK